MWFSGVRGRGEKDFRGRERDFWVFLRISGGAPEILTVRIQSKRRARCAVWNSQESEHLKIWNLESGNMKSGIWIRNLKSKYDIEIWIRHLKPTHEIKIDIWYRNRTRKRTQTRIRKWSRTRMRNRNEHGNEINNEHEHEIDTLSKIKSKAKTKSNTISNAKSKTKSETSSKRQRNRKRNHKRNRNRRDIIVYLKSGTGRKISLCS